MKTFKVKSTFKGMFSSLLASLIWIVIPMICAVVLNWCCMYFQWSESSIYDDVIVTFMVIGYILMAIVALYSLYNFFITAIYGPTNIMVFYLDDQEKINKITDTYYRFVNAKYHDEIVCSRIMSVEVYIPTLGSIFNTGTLIINFVSFANADFKKESRVILGVEFPEQVKERIIQASAAHEGLKIV